MADSSHRRSAPAMSLDEASLREAALRHLSRFSATEAGLRRVLGNRIRRWARAAEQAGQDPEAIRTETQAAEARAAAIAARLVQAGAVDDAAFAVARARRLRGAGRSAAAAMAHLASKGVSAETARAALAHEEVPDELTAALLLCRRRRIGPFAAAEPALETRRKWQGILGRGGFGGGVARQALGMDRAEAEAHLIAAGRP
ncbi:RecX family transcriptional regulator [Roseococcus microcysteis]|uniref:RecX family transcriptional regulator n=1 Tax=Roseococcus microcysteis TaxID=2771361 RepID=UPI00168ADDEA|nr:RecX family transcriptional regulator [Roseococcus microcysteis]